MRLQRVHLDGFRQLRGLDIELTGADGQPVPFLAMIGPNGCGKSSVLHALAALLDDVAGTNKPDRPQKKDEPWRPEGTVEHAEFRRTSLRGFSISKDRAPMLRFERVSFRWDPVAQPGNHDESAGILFHEAQETAKRSLFVPPGFNPPLYSLNALPGKTESLQEALDTDWIGAEGVGNEYGTGSNRVRRDRAQSLAVHTWLLKRQLEGGEPRLWEAIGRFLGDTVRFVGADRDRYDLLFHADGQQRRWNELSDGQRRLILLFAMVIMHCQDDGILLIDEPEAFLHPAWQMRLRDALCGLLPNGQVIAATHSPYIVRGLDPHEVFVFGADELLAAELQSVSTRKGAS